MPLNSDSTQVVPSTQALLTHWSLEPSIVIGLILWSVAYWYAVGPLRRRHNLGPPATRSQITWFVLSDLVVVIALLSPIDDIGDEYLFSVHMVQHLLIGALWPPLILLALPGWLVRPLFRLSWLSGLILFLTYPVVAIGLFNLDIYLWHLPVLYEATLQNEGIHILEHLTFMGLGVLNWWPVLSPIEEQRIAYPLQILYLFADGMLMMVLGILFTFAPTPFYSTYASAPRLWDISATTDQQIGGLIMWYPGNVPYAVLLVVAFYRWFDADEPSHTETHRVQSHTIEPPGP